MTFGSATVPTTNSQVGVIVPGNPIVFTSQPGVPYTVLSLTATSITVSSPYTGVTNLATTASWAPNDNVVGFVSQPPVLGDEGTGYIPYLTIQVDI